MSSTQNIKEFKSNICNVKDKHHNGKSYTLNYYCFDCNDIVCQKCAAKDHTDHKFYSIDEIKIIYESKINQQSNNNSIDNNNNKNNKNNSKSNKSGKRKFSDSEDIFDSNTEKLWNETKESVALFENLKRSEFEMSVQFKKLRDYIDEEETRIKQQIVKDSKILKDGIDQNLRNLVDILGLVNKICENNYYKDIEKKIDEIKKIQQNGQQDEQDEQHKQDDSDSNNNNKEIEITGGIDENEKQQFDQDKQQQQDNNNNNNNNQSIVSVKTDSPTITPTDSQIILDEDTLKLYETINNSSKVEDFISANQLFIKNPFGVESNFQLLKDIYSFFVNYKQHNYKNELSPILNLNNSNINNSDNHNSSIYNSEYIQKISKKIKHEVTHIFTEKSQLPNLFSIAYQRTTKQYYLYNLNTHQSRDAYSPKELKTLTDYLLEILDLPSAEHHIIPRVYASSGKSLFIFSTRPQRNFYLKVTSNSNSTQANFFNGFTITDESRACFDSHNCIYIMNVKEINNNKDQQQQQRQSNDKRHSIVKFNTVYEKFTVIARYGANMNIQYTFFYNDLLYFIKVNSFNNQFTLCSFSEDPNDSKMRSVHTFNTPYDLACFDSANGNLYLYQVHSIIIYNIESKQIETIPHSINLSVRTMLFQSTSSISNYIFLHCDNDHYLIYSIEEKHWTSFDSPYTILCFFYQIKPTIK